VYLVTSKSNEGGAEITHLKLGLVRHFTGVTNWPKCLDHHAQFLTEITSFNTKLEIKTTQRYFPWTIESRATVYTLTQVSNKFDVCVTVHRK
jgi:hypothetical protein